MKKGFSLFKNGLVFFVLVQQHDHLDVCDVYRHYRLTIAVSTQI